MIAEWTAYDRIEPIGPPRAEHLLKVALAWVVSHLAEKAMEPDDIKGISVEMPEPSEDIELLEDTDDADSIDQPETVRASSAAILRDLSEQNLFH